MELSAPQCPDTATLAALAHLLAPLQSSPDNWTLSRIERSGALHLTFTHPEQDLVVWLAPNSTNQPAFQSTLLFKIGHLGEATPLASTLLQLLAHTIQETEQLLSTEDVTLLTSKSPTAERPHLLGSDLELRITERCNEACPFCSARGWCENRFSSPELVIEAIRDAKLQGANRIVFSGGEPTLVPQLPAFVAEAKSRGLQVVLQSNGLVPSTLQWWQRFTDASGQTALPDSLFLSMHTQFSAKTGLLTGVPGTLHKKLATARLAHRLGLKVAVNFVVTRLNLDELHDFPRFLTSRLGRWPELVISIAAPVGSAEKTPDILVSIDQLRPQLRKALSAAAAQHLSAQVAEACGVPICTAPEHDHYFAAFYRQTEVTALAPDRVKSPTCATCKYNPKCIGVWSFYADHYGLTELQPVH